MESLHSSFILSQGTSDWGVPTAEDDIPVIPVASFAPDAVAPPSPAPAPTLVEAMAAPQSLVFFPFHFRNKMFCEILN